jgi:hypothetical protein
MTPGDFQILKSTTIAQDLAKPVGKSGHREEPGAVCLRLGEKVGKGRNG